MVLKENSIGVLRRDIERLKKLTVEQQKAFIANLMIDYYLRDRRERYSYSGERMVDNLTISCSLSNNNCCNCSFKKYSGKCVWDTNIIYNARSICRDNLDIPNDIYVTSSDALLYIIKSIIFELFYVKHCERLDI